MSDTPLPNEDEAPTGPETEATGSTAPQTALPESPPPEDSAADAAGEESPPGGPEPEVTSQPPSQDEQGEEDDSELLSRRRGIAGIALILLGLFFLAQQFFGDFWSWTKWWPLIVVAIGLVILLRGGRS